MRTGASGHRLRSAGSARTAVGPAASENQLAHLVLHAAEDARRVVRLLGPLTRVKVNLIPWNPGNLPYRAPTPESIEEFQRILVDKGVPTFVRYSRGQDVFAACGQLALIETVKPLVMPSATSL